MAAAATTGNLLANRITGNAQNNLLAGLEEAKRHRANLIMFFATIAIVSVIVPAWNVAPWLLQLPWWKRFAAVTVLSDAN